MGRGDYSALTSFDVVIAFVATPWPIICLGVLFSAYESRWQLHRLFANTLLKACIAVPLSRVGGAVLQRSGWETSSGYYTAIIASTLLISIWQIIEIWQFYSWSKKSIVNKAD